MDNIKYSPAGDQGVVINFGDRISENINQKIYSAVNQINTVGVKGVIEVIPSYTSLLVIYDRHKISYAKLQKKLEILIQNLKTDAEQKTRIHHIPVCYEGKYALDIEDVAKHCGLSTDEIINIHTSTDYLIYMLGFLPGFVYLGGMDERIECPRLTTPRTKIPAGGVGIGGKQTGIYPLESPGGWRIIGQTPIKVYDPERNPSILYSMGEKIRFVRISEKEYEDIKSRVLAGNYTHKVTEESMTDTLITNKVGED